MVFTLYNVYKKFSEIDSTRLFIYYTVLIERAIHNPMCSNALTYRARYSQPNVL